MRAVNPQKLLLLCGFAAILPACATTQPVPVKQGSQAAIIRPAQIPVQTPVQSSVPIADPAEAPKAAPAVTTPPKSAPPPPQDSPAPEISIPFYESPMTALPLWAETDHRPAFAAFKRSCVTWSGAQADDYINPHLKDYGKYSDWASACELAKIMTSSKQSAQSFFENEFAPAELSATSQDAQAKGGLLTGYYQPEISVRKVPSRVYSEPILATPQDKSKLTLSRAQVNANTSRVIAYGKPIDVFFMQVQGSGHLRYADGRIIRAGYAANNGQPYRSIGGVLIRRGEMTKEQASKDSIEAWMKKSGPLQTRALMNENPRYIYFEEQAIIEGEGPMGGMRVPLTAMGSMAVDPRYHPYGTIYHISGKIPARKGDYKGQDSGQLLVAQDTGKAIRGPKRGDLYFGSGDAAGDRAGVMKHKMKWMTLLPRALAERIAARTQPTT